MQTTAQDLYNCCLRGEMPTLPVIVDYFGDAKGMKNRCTVLGVYQGLVKTKGMTVELLENCFKTNRLNELVHEKYKYRQSGYYRKFCEAGINLDTKSCLDPETEERMAILDDDFCPNCEKEGYILEKHGKGYIDCETCLQLMCEFCCKKDGGCKKCWGKPAVR